MALKAVLTSKTELDALAEPVRALYTETNGKWRLDVDDVVLKSEADELKTKLGEFRDNNRTMHNELEALRPLKTKYEGVDADEYKTLKEEKEKLAKKGLKNVDDIEAMITNAVQLATKPLAEKLTAAEERTQRAQEEINRNKFRELVTADATKARVKASSLRHIIRDAEDTFELKDGQLVAKAGVKHPTEPHRDLTTHDWLQHLSRTEVELFEPSGGGGARPGNGNGNGNPNAKQLINPTSEEMGRNMDAIAKGEMVVIRTAQ